MTSGRRRSFTVLLMVAALVVPAVRAEAQTPTLFIDDVGVTEGSAGTTNIVFTIRVSEFTTSTVSGLFSTNPPGGSFTATNGTSCGGSTDFVTVTNQPFSIPPNTASTTATVIVCGDTTDEGDELFTATLSNVSNAVCIESSCIAVGTIRDDEPLVSLSPDVDITEGDTGTTTVTITVSFTPAPAVAFTLPLETVEFGAVGGASCTAGVDYISPPSSLSINPGTTFRTVNVQICGDLRDEPTQEFSFRLGVGPGYEFGTNATTDVRILDNDAAPSLTIPNVSTTEGNPCTAPCLSFTVATFNVTLSQPSDFTVTVNFATSNDTGTGGSGVGCSGSSTVDFLSASGTLTFAPGDASEPIAVFVCKDSVLEANQTYFVTLSNPSNATCTGGDCQGLGTIVNDDSKSGTFVLDPQNATVATGEHLLSTLVWTVPSPQVWRDLTTIDVRIAGDGGTAIWVRWDEAANTFGLCRATTDDPDPAQARCGRGATPGSSHVLQTALARLHLAGSSVEGSGTTGPSVTLRLDLSFKPGARGETYEITVAAADDLGNLDEAFLPAGSVEVL